MNINQLKLNAENFYEINKDKFEHSMELFEEFITLYPFHENPQRIDTLGLNDIYNPGNPSFLYYIEHRLTDFGKISIGSAQYAKNAKKQISTFKKLLHIAVNDSISIASKVDAHWEEIKFFGGDRHLAKKIIFCYNTNKILPIYNTNHLEHFASKINPEFNFKQNKFNKDYEDLSLGEKFEYLNDIILEFKKDAIKTEMNNVLFMWFLYDYLTPPDYNKKGKTDNPIDSEPPKTYEHEFLKFLKEIYSHEMQVALGELKRGKNVILYGPPGSGKTVLSKIVSEEHLGKNAYSLYTVHSGTDYYDLVCRIVPQINEDGNLVYSKESRFLLDALLSGKVLILDEINRTQIDTALGIFFTYLERDHRINDVEQIREILKKETDKELEINDLRTKLDNFRIIGTLNVYDKTFLFKLGDALKRRFTFIEITTKKDLIEKITSSEEFKKEFRGACDYKGDLNTANTIIDVFSNLNNIKPLGIGILKDSLQFSSNFSENAADLSISSLIVPFFENDLNYSNILTILEKYDLNVSINKLKSLNFGTSDINGI